MNLIDKEQLKQAALKIHRNAEDNSLLVGTTTASSASQVFQRPSSTNFVWRVTKIAATLAEFKVRVMIE